MNFVKGLYYIFGHTLRSDAPVWKHSVSEHFLELRVHKISTERIFTSLPLKKVQSSKRFEQIIVQAR